MKANGIQGSKPGSANNFTGGSLCVHFVFFAAAMVVPAAAAHAQVGVYVGPSIRYEAPGYAPIHWDHRVYGRPYVGGPWIAPPVYYGYRHEWRGYRGWGHDGRYAYGRRW